MVLLPRIAYPFTSVRNSFLTESRDYIAQPVRRAFCTTVATADGSSAMRADRLDGSSLDITGRQSHLSGLTGSPVYQQLLSFIADALLRKSDRWDALNAAGDP